MYLYNLPLQLKFSTNEANHYDFGSNHPKEVLLGYNWDKRANTLIPNVVVSQGHLGGDRKGIELASKPFDSLTITKRTVLSAIKVSLKIMYSKVCMLIPDMDGKSFNTPISQACADLALCATKACNELIHLYKINPI